MDIGGDFVAQFAVPMGNCATVAAGGFDYERLDVRPPLWPG
jgi:hypothetical protein